MNTYKKQFFDKLADKLEKYFPKGECKERGKALMLNSYANIYFEDFLMKAVVKEKERLYEKGYNEAVKNKNVVISILMKDFKDLSIKVKEKKKWIEELLPELYLIRANIPLTWGKVSRQMFKELLNKLEKQK